MNKRIIVALDSNNINNTKHLVSKLKNEVFAFKIGYEFFLNFGLNGYNEIKKICPRIFLDLKLHDIPNTVENGIKAIEKLEPILTTIHISGGDEMQKLSVFNKKRRVKIIGVSVLTSLNSAQTKKYYNEINIEKIVKKFVMFAQKNKLDGIDIGLIIGGPPCQGFSLAGKRKKDDKRNKLYLEYFEMIKQYNPKCFVMENVKGILK